MAVEIINRDRGNAHFPRIDGKRVGRVNQSRSGISKAELRISLPHANAERPTILVMPVIQVKRGHLSPQA